jgi:hypothetical protein
MRNVVILSTAVLTLASTGVASAQQAQPAQTPPPQAAPEKSPATQPGLPNPGVQGLLDFGYRGSSWDGEQARWERYRDLRSGVVGGGNFISEKANSVLRFDAANVGYRDQTYTADYNQYGKVKVSAMWNSIPLNYSYNALTPWKDQGNNVWTLDAAARMAVQNKTPGVLGIGTTGANYNQASIFRAPSSVFSLQSRRDILGFGMKYHVTNALQLNVDMSSTHRGGTQPFGGSFAFSNGNEQPVSLDDRTNDVTAGLEWVNAGTSMLRAEWVGSWFKNQFQSLTWDNPLRATDFTNGKVPTSTTNGPWDNSGYSNGNGPATGRMALSPSNNMNTFRLVGLRKLPGHSSINGHLSFTAMNQNEDLIPWTTNSVIANSAVYAFFPGLASLPRPTAEAEVHGANALVNFSTQPTDYFGFDMRYRFNDRENRTPFFDAHNTVRFDAVPEDVPGLHPGKFNIRQNTFETGATLTVLPNSSIRLGYIMDDVKRTGRTFGDLTDYTFRLSMDKYGNQYVMLRGIYENTRRVGSGFSVEALDESGTQEGARFYDEAPLNRNKGTIIVQVTPTEKLDFGLSVAAGKDKYNHEGLEFGLLSNSNQSYNATFNLYPTSVVTFSGNYGYEKLSSLQKSRNANPFSGVAGAYESWTDPNRDWSLDNGETVHTYGLNLDVIKALPNTDVRFSYYGSKSDNAFLYSGPRIQELSTNVALTARDGLPCGAGISSCFEALPDVTNNWQQFGVSVKYLFGMKYGLNVGYSYEKLRIVDFATSNLPDGSPRMDVLGALTTGYGNRPYKGQALTMRFMYLFQPGSGL